MGDDWKKSFERDDRFEFRRGLSRSQQPRGASCAGALESTLCGRRRKERQLLFLLLKMSTPTPVSSLQLLQN
jgi:hypothetical protein